MRMKSPASLIFAVVVFSITTLSHAQNPPTLNFTATPNYDTTVCTAAQLSVTSLKCSNLIVTGDVSGVMNYNVFVSNGQILPVQGKTLSYVTIDSFPMPFAVTGGTVSSVYAPPVKLPPPGGYSQPTYTRTAIVDITGNGFTGTLTILIRDYYSGAWRRQYDSFTGELTPTQ
jgi:hypothetical protein